MQTLISISYFRAQFYNDIKTGKSLRQKLYRMTYLDLLLGQENLV